MLATIRGTAIEFDTIKPEEVVARLQPLTKPGNPWFGSAGEMTAMALLKQNRKAEAGRLFAQIAADKAVPESIRSPRGADRRTLGVDASASLPASAHAMTHKEKFRMRKRIAILMIAAAMASGCNLFKKGGPKTPVVGERIAVLTSEIDIVVDPETAARPLALPEAGRQ